jgi:hypothetical protein
MSHPPQTSAPIAPTVFGLLDKYLDGWDDVDEEDESGPSPSELSAFLHAFFQQFFQAEWKVEISTIDQKGKVQAARIRLGRPDIGAETTALIRAYEDLCDRWADVMDLHYSGHSGDIREFLGTVMPRVLSRIRSWARKAGHQLVGDQADAASKRLEEMAL